MTDDGFSEVTTIMEEAFGMEFTETKTRVWRMILDELTDEEVKRAVVALTRTLEYPPKPADIFRQVRGDPDDVAELAWARLIQAIREDGAYASVNLGDPALHLAIESVGGWEYVCHEDSEELYRFTKPQFCRSYRAFLKNPQRNAPLALAGIFERENRLHGYEEVQLDRMLTSGED